ncbi:MAG: NAD-dependent epimerase/dehydratase family protein, partial [Acidimicrobiales bacterium]|nr:NAD-dependent epimerase/dehydratase family protein [Acidimicrobiales bacterium]
MPSRLRLGVTGARGFIGSKLTQAALDAGHEVHTFCRSSWTGVPFVPRACRHQLTLPDAPDPRDLEGLDALIHLAVAPHGSSEETSFAVNVTGTVRLQEAAAAAGVERFIFVSTQSAHDGARNRYGRSKRAAERALDRRQGVMILRPGLVYDGSENGLLGRSAKAAAKLGVFPVVGGDRAMVQTLWFDDLVSVLLRFA